MYLALTLFLVYFVRAEEICETGQSVDPFEGARSETEMLQVLQRSLANMVNGVFEKTDADSDGLLDMEETDVFREALESILEDLRIGILDPDGDGFVTSEEAQVSLQRDFDEMVSRKLARDRGIAKEIEIGPEIINRDGVVIRW